MFSYICIVNKTSNDFKFRKEVRVLAISGITLIGYCLKILNHYILLFICTSLILSYTIISVFNLGFEHLLIVLAIVH